MRLSSKNILLLNDVTSYSEEFLLCLRKLPYHILNKKDLSRLNKTTLSSLTCVCNYSDWNFNFYTEIQKALNAIQPNVPLGVIIHINNEKTIQQLLKKKINSVSENFILADNLYLSENPTHVISQYSANSLTYKSTEALIKKEADMSVIVGHGREDVIYYKNFAFCGISKKTKNYSFCTPDNCPYPQKKIFIDNLNSKVVFLISCSAGKIKEGILSEKHSLSYTLLENQNTLAVIAPYKLFTLKKELIDFLLFLITKKYTLGEITRQLGDFHTAITKEPSPFILFGNPNLKVVIPKVKNLRSYRDISQSQRYLELLNKSLSECFPAFEFLQDIDFLDPEIKNLSTFLAQREGALKKINLSVKSSFKVIKNLHLITSELLLHFDKKIAESLSKKSLQSYFWLASYYNYFTLKSSVNETCHKCSNNVSVEKFHHPFKTYIYRIRKTCLRCGIISDSSSSHELRIINLLVIKSRSGYKVSFNVLSNKIKTGVAAISINNANDKLRFPKSVVDSKSVRLPLHINLNKSHTGPKFEFTFQTNKKGVYYLHFFLISNLNITIATTPVIFK